MAAILAFVALETAGCGGTRLISLAPEVTLPPVTCTRYASPDGSESGDGSRGRPYASVQTLVDRLAPGETGCLEAGTYRENVTVHVGGTAVDAVTLAGAPGAKAELVGSFWVERGADDVIVRDLGLNGSSPRGVPSPQVNADRTTFYDVDVTNDHTGICFLLGGAGETYGAATRTTIARSRIHDCGTLPPTSFEHGIYVAHSRGATIVDNAIYDNADWGVQLYPDAQRTRIEFNVLDGNGDGLIFAGTDGWASSGNVVARNVISNTRPRKDGGYGYLVSSFWGGKRRGDGNLLVDNCLWNGDRGDVNQDGGGFTADGNLVADPEYVSRADKDFSLSAGSPCAGDGPRAPGAGAAG